MAILTDYLTNSAQKFPKKVALVDKDSEITYESLNNLAMKVAGYIVKESVFENPVAVFMSKSNKCIIAFWGILYSGNFYAMLDIKNPDERLGKIYEKLLSPLIITDNENIERAKSIFKNARIVLYEDMINAAIDNKVTEKIQGKIDDNNPAAIYFTSGSTGIPKGVMLTGKGMFDFIEWINETFNPTSDIRAANQTAFYFCMSFSDIFLTIKKGGTLYIVPQMYFMFPAKLAEFLQNNHINWLWWVPTALMSLAKPEIFENYNFYIKTIIFGSEVFVTKYLNLWMEKYPDTCYANLYGPTECTDTTHYYVITKKLKDEEPIPMGKTRKNVRELILNENDTPTQKGETGELCILGDVLSPGYYNEPERTLEVFVKNPLNNKEIMYRTGDLVRYNECGDLIYMGRKDSQIKKNGYRIELGEIEAAANAIDGVDLSSAVFNPSNKEITLYYTGNIEIDELKNQIEARVPKYMMPENAVKLEKMPLNANGKIDRYKLKIKASNEVSL